MANPRAPLRRAPGRPRPNAWQPPTQLSPSKQERARSDFLVFHGRDLTKLSPGQVRAGSWPGVAGVSQVAGAEAVDRRGISVGGATLIRSCSPWGPEMSSSRAALAIWSNGTRTDVSGVGRWLTIGMSL